MRHALAVLAVLVLAVPAQAQEARLSKEDVAKLARAGVSDDLIVSVIESAEASFELSVDDITALKRDGVSDKVLAAMLGKGAAAPAAAPKSEGNLTVRNTAQRAVRVTVNERDGIVDFSQTGGNGQELGRGAGMTFSVRAGEYRVMIEGGSTRHTVRLPATLLVKGADTAYLDVMTLTVEDARGREVMILHSEGKVLPEHVRHEDPGYISSHRGFRGPRAAYLPLVTENVLLGAGIGAIIGHQSGQRTKGAIIGAGAGLLLDCWRWNRYW